MLTGREAITLDAAVDTSNCDREPIHIPGSIQPHGFLLWLLDPDGQVRVGERQCGSIPRPPGRVGGRVDAGRSFRRRDREGPPRESRGHRERGQLAAPRDRPGGCGRPHVECRGPSPCGADDRRVRAALGAWPHGDPGIFSPVTSARSSPGSTATADMAELNQIAAEEIRRLTGFDRVLVYRFDDDWNGTVIAEDRNDASVLPRPPLPGLRHPGPGPRALSAQPAPADRRRRLTARCRSSRR